jgi:hypothetical protein
MPCHPARARELVRKGKAVRRFNQGMFYIQLTERESGDIQPIAIGIDPGSKKEGITIKSEAHTHLNIQADAVTWVRDAVETRREMRRSRRFRKTPCRAIGSMPRFLAATAQRAQIAGHYLILVLKSDWNLSLVFRPQKLPCG